MKIALAADHGGVNEKNAIREWLGQNGYETVDFGTNGTESCDYPDYALPAAKSVAAGECEFGILVCGTGIGMSIAANKVRGIRCAHCTDPLSARLTRAHNNANMLALGGRITGRELLLEIVREFLATPFEGGRHERRIRKIAEIEAAETKADGRA